MSLFVPPRLADRPVPMKAGPVGPGSGVLMTEFPLATLLLGGDKASPQIKMRKALQIARETGWIDAAEAVIGGTITGQPWGLEDADEKEIPPNSSGDVGRAYNVIANPYRAVPLGRKYSRVELWQMTLRHVGLCGNAFWFMDQVDGLAGTPDATIYVAPWRMSPNEDDAGNLLSWQLDKTPRNEGVKIELDQIVHFVLRPPDEGHFGRGLVEIALIKAQNSVGLDKHIRQVLDAGGRLSGLLAPKSGDTVSPEQAQMIEREARNVTEQPDAAKRLQILRGPVEFIQTTMTVQDLQIVELMKLSRDDLLALWGVPLSQIGGASPAGLNSGEVRKYDKQALWENANHPRVVSFVGAIQTQMLDKWQGLGSTVVLEIEEPEFDDDSSRYDLVAKSLNTPMRTFERRALINLEPFGEKAINPETGIPYDEEILLPAGMSRYGVAPEDGIPPGSPLLNPPEPPETTEVDTATEAVGETPQAGGIAKTGKPVGGAAPRNPNIGGKASLSSRQRALHGALKDLRASLDERLSPQVKRNVHAVLSDQEREIASRVKSSASHLMANPRDIRVWWDGPKWDRKLREALAPSLLRMAEEVDVHVRSGIGRATAKAGPVAAVERALTKSGTRITNINHRTRDAVLATVRKTVASAIERGLSPADAGDELEDAIGSDVSLVNGVSVWDEYRAEMIARTEMTAAYNDATLGSYADLDVTEVQAIDGDEDPECAERDGQTFSVEEADAIEDHPNGTLDWVPVIPDDEGEAE